MCKILISKDVLRDDLQAFIDLGFKYPYVVAHMDVNIEFDKVYPGDMLKLGEIKFHFIRNPAVKLEHKYWIMTEEDYDNMMHQQNMWYYKHMP